MEDAIEETQRRLRRLPSAAAVREQDNYTVAHAAAVQRDVDEIWSKLQAGKLHKDRRVVAANLRAGKVVGELFILFAMAPDLVDSDFARSHRSLARSNYIKFYENISGSPCTVRIPKRLCGFMAPDRLIGFSQPQSDHYAVPVHDFIMAKDYVASFTDHRASSVYTQLLGFGG
jgi:dGTPase